jgi:hypothetical protein
MAIVTYLKSKGYTGPRKQPLADLLLHGPTGSFSTAGALVDSGADLVQLPGSAGVTTGLLPSAILVGGVFVGGLPLPSGSKWVAVTTVGGSITMLLLSSVPIEVEGIAISVDVVFHPNGTSRPLVGRNAIVALNNVGFDATNWLL